MKRLYASDYVTFTEVARGYVPRTAIQQWFSDVDQDDLDKKCEEMYSYVCRGVSDSYVPKIKNKDYDISGNFARIASPGDDVDGFISFFLSDGYGSEIPNDNLKDIARDLFVELIGLVGDFCANTLRVVVVVDGEDFMNVDVFKSNGALTVRTFRCGDIEGERNLYEINSIQDIGEVIINFYNTSLW